MELKHDPAIPLLFIQKQKTLIQKGTCTPMFIAMLFTIAKILKQSKCLNNRWVAKDIYTMEHYLAIKKLPFAAT